MPAQGARSKQSPNINCHAELTPASSISPQPINWLWPNWIARGKLTVLAGAGGSGKTTLAIGLIGTLTSGGRWPDGERCSKPGNVLIWSSEDDIADTLVPRLVAAGADLSRVHFIKARINENGDREPFDPANDINLLNENLATIEGGVALLLIDPIVCAIKGDMHRANDVRRGLQAVVDFAEKNKCAVLGISHFSKGSIGGIPAERVIGSQAFSALARTVLVAAKQENSNTRVLAHAKSNISDDQGGVEYFIVPCTIGDGIETTCVHWGDKIDGSARDILANAEKIEKIDSEDYEKRTALESACQFLQEELKDGPVASEQIEADAKNAGCSWSTVKRAKNKIGVSARKKPEKNGSWDWILPEDAQKATKALTEDNEHLQEEMSTFDDSDTEEL
ncbi:AAA family ATPase [Pseudomonas putida]|uniref:AAA family ATPase n=2 Tax=Pseudomonas putida TaxID=303 RepID=A0A2Z4RTD7_PSEPU|nr:AAA family ATPase [Pseudomonas putida]